MADLNTAWNERLAVQILAWTEAEAFQLESEEAILASTNVTWPDGETGIWTCTIENLLFGVPDAFTITYVRGGTTLTVTQPEVSRDSEGTITFRPTLSIS